MRDGEGLTVDSQVLWLRTRRYPSGSVMVSPHRSQYGLRAVTRVPPASLRRSRRSAKAGAPRYSTSRSSSVGAGAVAPSRSATSSRCQLAPGQPTITRSCSSRPSAGVRQSTCRPRPWTQNSSVAGRSWLGRAIRRWLSGPTGTSTLCWVTTPDPAPEPTRCWRVSGRCQLSVATAVAAVAGGSPPVRPSRGGASSWRFSSGMRVALNLPSPPPYAARLGSMQRQGRLAASPSLRVTVKWQSSLGPCRRDAPVQWQSVGTPKGWKRSIMSRSRISFATPAWPDLEAAASP